MTFPSAHPALERALAARAYSEPTPVQAAVLEPQAAGRDLLVSAQTGSGKTVAFGLAMADQVLGEDQLAPRPGAPLALIIAPTRELALQVARELAWLYADARCVIATCVGGMDARREQRNLANGCHIVVGTPGRLRDHLERNHLDPSALRAVVLDEADEMLDLGFREDLEFILESAPKGRRTLLFSATIEKDIATLARTFQNDALRIETRVRGEQHGDIEYRALRVLPSDVEHAVVNVLRLYEAPGALVFCNQRESVRHLQSSLRERGFDVVGLSGELSQRERNDALQALRDGRAKVCVATDVAARGIDLPDLGLVIHAELPMNSAGLLHRSGRTGRAGRKGTSVLIVPINRMRKAHSLLGDAGVEASWGPAPSADEVRAADERRILEDPSLVEPLAEEDASLAYALMARLTPEQIAGALVRLRRTDLPSPEEVFEATEGAKSPAWVRKPERAPRERSERNERFEHGERPQRAERGERPDRGERPPRVEGGRWFRLTVGRERNADPKWLIPLICRLGDVTKPDIGAIRIFDRETKFEISQEAAEAFAQASAGKSDGDIRIEPAAAPGGPKPGGPRPPREEGDRPFKPRFDKGPPRNSEERPFKPRFDKGPPRDAEERPFKPRLDREATGATDGKPERRPYRERDGDPPKPYKPRPEGEARAFKPKDDRGPPRDGPFKPRSEGGKPFKKPYKKGPPK